MTTDELIENSRVTRERIEAMEAELRQVVADLKRAADDFIESLRSDQPAVR